MGDITAYQQAKLDQESKKIAIDEGRATSENDWRGKDTKMKQDQIKTETEMGWANFAGGLAGAIGGMVLEGYKMKYQAEVAMAQTSAQVQITGMQEDTKRLAIEADRTIQLRRGEVTQKVAEYQKDVEITKTKGAVKIKEIEAETQIAVEANKNRSLEIVAAQKMAHDAWLRSSYQNPSPFAA